MAYRTLQLSVVPALVVALCTLSAVAAAPSRQARAADGPHDDNWRLITGLKASYEHVYSVSLPYIKSHNPHPYSIRNITLGPYLVVEVCLY